MPQTVLGEGMKSLTAVCTMCNDAEITFKDGQYTRVGEPTEAALKVLVEKLGMPGVPPPSNILIAGMIGSTKKRRMRSGSACSEMAMSVSDACSRLSSAPRALAKPYTMRPACRGTRSS